MSERTEHNTEIEQSETYSVSRIRAAFAEHAGKDEWGVPCFYEDGLIASLRGEYDREGCRHRFPDGTRCTLSDEAHAEVPGLARVHGYSPVLERGLSSGVQVAPDPGPRAGHDHGRPTSTADTETGS